MNSLGFDIGKMIDGIYGGAKKDDYFSFNEWKARTKEARNCLIELRESYDEILKSMEPVYSASYIAEHKSAYEQDVWEWAAHARKMAYDDLAAVINARREAYKKANAAPTTDQLNLLTVLNMRSTLSATEVANAIPHVANSLQCLKLLAEIAHKHDLPFPKLNDDFEEDLGNAEEYGKTIIQREIDKPTAELGYLSRLFWTTDNGGQMQPTFDRLDNPSYISENVVIPEGGSMKAEAL